MDGKLHNNQLELWGGIECTINRVKNRFFDQLEFSDHYNRPGDLEAVAELGIKALRYPVLWEKHQPYPAKQLSWNFVGNQLHKLKHYQIEPIVGLVHHGSGPGFVNFLDGSFEKGLAEYAYQVARAFPWVEYYTPVNEPLTTARFCGLYGHWFPHKTDDYHFARILLSECRGIVMAMQRIRQVNPAAKLVQTEDLTRIYSTPVLKYQADFENNRKWLAYDLISGKVVREHPLYGYLLLCGIEESELAFFQEHNCSPDIIGLNHYVTSERYLDHNFDRYPIHTIGSNQKHRYADVEAVRVNFEGMYGARNLLIEAWNRFHITMAITEVHLNCHREEQLRWIAEIWQTAKELRNENIDIKAVTSWALFGSFGWNKLLTGPEWRYEPGVFDVRNGRLRPLATRDLLRCLAGHEQYEHPVLQGRGWWKRESRFIFEDRKTNESLPWREEDKDRQPLLLVGSANVFYNTLVATCKNRDIYFIETDLTDGYQLENHIRVTKPWAVVLACPGVVNTADENSFDPVQQLLRMCTALDLPLMLFDFVNDEDFTPEFSSVHNSLPEVIDEYTGNTLPLVICVPYAEEIVTDVANGPTIHDAVNAGLDLLIDKETGYWRIQDQDTFFPLKRCYRRDQVA